MEYTSGTRLLGAIDKILSSVLSVAVNNHFGQKQSREGKAYRLQITDYSASLREVQAGSQGSKLERRMVFLTALSPTKELRPQPKYGRNPEGGCLLSDLLSDLCLVSFM